MKYMSLIIVLIQGYDYFLRHRDDQGFIFRCLFINRPASHSYPVSLVFLHGIILVAQPTCVLLLSINGKLICQVMEGMHFHLPFNAYEATRMSFFVFCILYHDCRS